LLSLFGEYYLPQTRVSVCFLRTTSCLLNQAAQTGVMRITKIQDDGERFIVHGSSGLHGKLCEVFDQMGLGISVTSSDSAEANILYTENNRDLVLRVLRERTEGEMGRE
jgi:hypothetical protein